MPKNLSLYFLIIILSLGINSHENWEPTKFSPKLAHEPSPLPDRVVLTWEDDPATSQSVTWRTDVSIKAGKAHLAIANSNGRALDTKEFKATTSYFKSDIN